MCTPVSGDQAGQVNSCVHNSQKILESYWGGGGFWCFPGRVGNRFREKGRVGLAGNRGGGGTVGV